MATRRKASPIEAPVIDALIADAKHQVSAPEDVASNEAIRKAQEWDAFKRVPRKEFFNLLAALKLQLKDSQEVVRDATYQLKQLEAANMLLTSDLASTTAKSRKLEADLKRANAVIDRLLDLA